MSSVRKITLHGHTSQDAKFSVMVDNNPVAVGTRQLFSFYTSTRLHGSSNIVIHVSKGHIVLTNCTATYPAIFNNTVEGTITFVQPIQEPVAVIKDQKIYTLPFDIRICADETFEYQHLTPNGPTRYNVLVEDINPVPGVDIFIGDKLKSQYVRHVIKHVAEYDYDYLSNDVRSTKDIEKLKTLVLQTYNFTK